MEDRQRNQVEETTPSWDMLCVRATRGGKLVQDIGIMETIVFAKNASELFERQVVFHTSH